MAYSMAISDSLYKSVVRGSLTFKRRHDPLGRAPNALSFFVLGNRTRRAIAASPCLLLGQRLHNVAPFLDREFMALAMAVPPQGKLSGELYRRLLRTIRPALDKIPSSNDKDWPAAQSWPQPPHKVTATRFSARLARWVAWCGQSF